MPSFDPETMLANRAWLAAIARDLLGDSSRVEDAVHDTWVAALERPPASRDERRVRAWLATVVRNAARQRVRGDERRRAREAACARPEAQDSASSTERLALQRDLAAALLELEPLARELVVLRYFDGLPPREIARRKGLTSNAVRTRLSRALAALRERLDDAYGGDRRAWSAVLTASLSPDRLVRPTAGLTGALIMQTWSKVLLGAALTVVLATLAFQSLVEPANDEGVEALASAEARPAPGSGPEFLPEVPEVSGAREPASVDDVEESRPEQPAADAASFVPVHVRFVDTSGRPLPGVRMRARAGGRDWLESAASGADGRAVLRLPWPPRSSSPPRYSEQLQFFGPAVALRLHTVRLPGPDPIFVGDIDMNPGGSVRGRVLVDGAPAPGVYVWVSPPQPVEDPTALEVLRLRGAPGLGSGGPSDVTDDDGRYHLVGAPAMRLEVWARDRDRLCDTTGPLDLAPGATLDAPDLTLEPIGPDRVVSGLVLGPDGEPAPGLRARLFDRIRDPEGSRGHTSAASGEFRLLAAPGVPYALELEDESGALEAHRVMGVRAGTHDLVVRLAASRFLVVRATSPDGAPVADVWVTRDPAEGRASAARSEDLERGCVRVLLADEPFSLTVGAVGYLPETLGPIDPRDAPDEVAVTLRPSGGIQGIVRAAEGRVANVAVHAHLVEQDGAADETTADGLAALQLRPSRTECTTGPDGAFFLPLYEDGTYVLHAEADGFARRALAPLAWRAGEQRTVAVELERGGAIEGQLLVAPGLSPAGATIVASRGNVHFEHTLTDDAGRFSFAGLASGPWELIRSAPGLVRGAPSYRTVRSYPHDAIRVQVQDGATARVEFDLTAVAPVEVRGRVLLGGRAPSPSGSYVSASGAAWPATVGADGRIEVRVERPGDYEFGMSWDLGGRSAAMLTVPVELRAPSTELAIELPAGRIVVSSPSGDSLEGEYALLWSSGEPASRWEARLRSVPMTLAEVPAGTLELRRRDEGTRGPIETWTLVEEFSLEPDEARTLVLR